MQLHVLSLKFSNDSQFQFYTFQLREVKSEITSDNILKNQQGYEIQRSICQQG